MTFSGLLLAVLVTTFLVGAFIRKPLRCYITMVAAAVGMLLWAWLYDSKSVALLMLTCLVALALSALGAYARHDLERVTADLEPPQN